MLNDLNERLCKCMDYWLPMTCSPCSGVADCRGVVQTESALALQRDSYGPTPLGSSSDDSRTAGQSPVATRPTSPPVFALPDDVRWDDELESMLSLNGFNPADEASWYNIAPGISGVDVSWSPEDIKLDDVNFLPPMTDIAPMTPLWIDDLVPEQVQVELYVFSYHMASLSPLAVQNPELTSRDAQASSVLRQCAHRMLPYRPRYLPYAHAHVGNAAGGRQPSIYRIGSRSVFLSFVQRSEG